jgi:hypothetical protein
MIVRFPAYRQFSAARIEINDAVMALLIGARLGEHALKTSAASRGALLPSLYGQIPGIARVNRTAGDAAQLLADAETHLAYMAIPYALAVHEDFLVSAAIMVRDDGRDAATSGFALPRLEDLTKLSLETGHEYIAERCGTELDGTLLPLFHLIRRIRNRIIHAGGRPGSHLLPAYHGLPRDARESWEHLAGRPLPDAVESGRLMLEEGELVAVLAVSRNLVQKLNDLLAHKLSRGYWASLVVADYRAAYPQRFGERDRRMRRVQGFANQSYRALRLTCDELATVLGEGGSSY